MQYSLELPRVGKYAKEFIVGQRKTHQTMTRMVLAACTASVVFNGTASICCSSLSAALANGTESTLLMPSMTLAIALLMGQPALAGLRVEVRVFVYCYKTRCSCSPEVHPASEQC